MSRCKTPILIACLFVLSANAIKAQNEVGQLVINAGVGISPEFNGDISTLLTPGKYFPVKAFDNAPYLSDDYPPMYNTSSIIPNIGVTADYGIRQWFSIGIAASYQSETVNWTPEDFGLTSGQPFTFPYSDKVTRINVAARFLFHLVESTQFDVYTGFRIGVSYWNDFSYTPDTLNQTSLQYLKAPAYFICKQSLVVGSFQYLWGVHIYPSNLIGFNFELGLGSPYLGEFGITFRLNNRKSKPLEENKVQPQSDQGGKK